MRLCCTAEDDVQVLDCLGQPVLRQALGANKCCHCCAADGSAVLRFEDLYCVLLMQAQQLLESLSRRQLYKFVREVTVDARGQAQLHKHCQGGLPTPAQIVGHQSAAAHGVSALGLLYCTLDRPQVQTPMLSTSPPV